ncbi:MAG: hypothetical protein JWN95_1631 [Frankiales bacterium]|nr:hypothetical protein [Frankiales bacterium]
MTDPDEAARLARLAWSEPGVEEVGEGIFRIPLPLPSDGLRAVNVYAIVDQDGLTAIDGGWALAESEQVLESSLAGLGYQLGDIHDFLVTHVHRDHYTQAVSLRAKYGMRVSLGRGEQDNLDAARRAFAEKRVPGTINQMARTGAQSLVAKLRPAVEEADRSWAAHWTDPDRWLEDNEDVTLASRTLRVISTPGHTQGHVVFHDVEHGLMFAGDHVLPQITPSIGFEPSPGRWPLRDYLASLQLMYTVPDAVLFPAHGPAGMRVHQRVDELLQHHADRLDAADKIVRAGASSAYDVAQLLTWTRRERAFTDLHQFDQVLAVSETIAHLDVLVLQGRLSVSTDEAGVDRFESP